MKTTCPLTVAPLAGDVRATAFERFSRADEARSRGGRKLSLRVLSTNPTAIGLYESEGFVVEGVLRGEFVLEGREVDDVLMARWLG